jgi:hypothetical protein
VGPRIIQRTFPKGGKISTGQKIPKLLIQRRLFGL